MDTTEFNPVTVARDKNGLWNHPDYPRWEEDTPREVITAWAAERGGSFHYDRFEESASEEIADYWQIHSDCSAWQPSVDISGAVLVSIYDHEDGPIAVFFAPDAAVAAINGTAVCTCMDYCDTHGRDHVCLDEGMEHCGECAADGYNSELCSPSADSCFSKTGEPDMSDLTEMEFMCQQHQQEKRAFIAECAKDFA